VRGPRDHRFLESGGDPASLRRRIGLVGQYGLTHRMVPGVHVELTYNDFQDMFTNPGPYVELLSEKARQVVAGGAGILLTSGDQSIPARSERVGNRRRRGTGCGCRGGQVCRVDGGF
jgi:hypothetical protein